MRTVMIDGAQFELVECEPSIRGGGIKYMVYKPLPSPKKTIEEVADEMGCSFHIAVARAAEDRIKELEARLAKLEKAS